MNLLFIVHSLTGGGAERVCVSVANGLDNLGHKVMILTNKISDEDYRLASRIKVELRYLGKNVISRRYFYLKQLRQIIKDNQIDVVITINGSWLLMTFAICKLHGAKLVYSDHNAFERPQSSPMSLMLRLRKYYFSRICDQTTVLTNRDKELLKGRTDVTVMPNPLFLPVLANVPSKSKTILAVGRMDVWYSKGFDVLIKAWGKICDRYPEWKLNILGKANEKDLEQLKSFIHESKADRVNLVSFKKNVADEYKDCAVFVLSSRYEGFGLVLIEAMSQHCACIACDYKTRQKDIITDGVNGLICAPDNVYMLAEKISELLDNPEYLNRLQRNSTFQLERYEESHIVKNWENMLRSLF